MKKIEIINVKTPDIPKNHDDLLIDSNDFYSEKENIKNTINDIFDESRILKAVNPALEFKIHSLIYEINIDSPNASANSSKSIGYIIKLSSSEGINISLTFSFIEINDPVSI